MMEMRFIDQLRTEVEIHRDMETDFRSRRYSHAQDIARKYIDAIEEEARIAARAGNYERVEGKAVISGFCVISENDFVKSFVQCEHRKTFRKGKHDVWSVAADNELFEVFASAFHQMCDAEHITIFPFQAQLLDKNGQTVYHTLPMIVRKPKKEKIQAFGFPYQIEF